MQECIECHYQKRSSCNYISHLFGFACPKFFAVVSLGNVSCRGVFFPYLLNFSMVSLTKIGQGCIEMWSTSARPIDHCCWQIFSLYFYCEKASDASLVVDEPLDQYSKIQSVLILACIIYPILKSDKIVQQRWNVDSFTEAVHVIKVMDKRFLSGNNLGWFELLGFKGSM